jgi:hypothetical protein
MSEQNVVDAPSYNASEEYSGEDYGNSDFESSEPGGSDDGGQPGPGMGQSKSSRRRRRKRKNKVAGDGQAVAGGDGEAAAPAVPLVMAGESLALAASAAPQQSRRQPMGGQQNSSQQNNGQQQGQGGKRWKKKFRDRERRPGGGGGGGRSENPGNDFRADAGASNGSSYGGGNGGYRPDNFGNQAGGFKRKGKGGGGGQPRDRGFVGPMDHSYRASGEFGDAPPSTIQLSGRRGGHRHTGDSQPIDRSMPRPVPIPEGAQTHIYFFIEELFFQAKIQETAKKLGVKVAFIKNEKEALAEMTDGEENKPALIVFDLNNANAKPLTLIPKLKTKLKRSASIVGFLSHLQGDLKAKAVEAGCDVVMPRAAFSQNLPNLLRRYGVEEQEEVNFNC